MDYLQLVNRLIQETDMGDAIGSVKDQEGDYRLAVGWIQDAWTSIQRNRYEAWEFMRSVGSKELEPGKSFYTWSEMGTEVGRLRGDILELTASGGAPSGVRIYASTDSVGQHFAHQGRPMGCAMSSEGVHFVPTPDSAYTAKFRYLKKFQILREDNDIPTLPEEYQMAIVWKAMVDYARFEGNEWRVLRSDAKDSLSEVYQSMLNQLIK